MVSPAQLREILCVDCQLDLQADRAAAAEQDQALESSARDEVWAAGTACQEQSVPDTEGLACPRRPSAVNSYDEMAIVARRPAVLITFYSEQGATVPENLVCLCSKCHRQVHQGHLRIEGQAPHQLRFLDQAGRDLGWQSELELAQWLDFFVGWKGGQRDGFEMRLQTGRCKVAA